MNREVGRRQDRGGGDRCQRDDEDRGNQGNAVLSALHGVGSAGGGAVIARATSGSSPRRNTKRSSPRSLLVSRTSTAICGATAAACCAVLPACSVGQGAQGRGACRGKGGRYSMILGCAAY